MGLPRRRRDPVRTSQRREARIEQRGRVHRTRRRRLGWLRFHDLRHTFASHLIVDLRLDVAQVSRILGHARVGTTLNIYTHLFDEVRHSREVRSLLAGSAFAELLGADGDEDVISLPSPHPAGARRPSACERTAARWGIGTEAHPDAR